MDLFSASEGVLSADSAAALEDIRKLLLDPNREYNEVASRQFWDLSNILNVQQEAIALLLGQPVCPFPDRPLQLLVSALTRNADAAVPFIENAATLEPLACGRYDAAREFILVFAPGYRASARRLRNPGSSSVYFAPRVFENNAALRERFLSWLHSASTERAVHF
ncbi:MAG: hypothetical protein ACM3WS_05140 [Bacillota bacterium]